MLVINSYFTSRWANNCTLEICECIIPPLNINLGSLLSADVSWP